MTEATATSVRFRPTLREALYLVALAGIAVVIQLLVLPDQPGGPDMTTYVAIAKDELTKVGFWTDSDSFVQNFWAMAYPTFLAIAMRVLGDDLTRVLYLQILMAASLVLVPWVLARRLPRQVQVAAPAVLALCPALWWLGTTIGYEVLLAWLLCFSLALAWVVFESRNRASSRAVVFCAALSGLLAAGALLTQTKTLAVLPVLAYLLIKAGRRTALAGLGGLIIGLLPWMIRNFLVLGTPSPLTGNAGYNLWVGNNPDSINGGSMLVAPPVPPGESMTSAALHFMISQPERWIELTWLKAARLLEPVFLYPGNLPVGLPRTVLHLYAGVFGALLGIGVIVFLGARLLAGSRAVPAVTPLAIFCLVWFAAHVPFIAEPRYLTSVVPVTVVVALAAWHHVARRLGLLRGRSPSGGAAADHAAVQDLERRGMPVALDLATPSWRVESIVADARRIESSSTVSIPRQECGLPEEQHSWPDLYARTLKGVVLDVDSGLVFSDGRVIAQSGSGTRASRDAAFVSGATFRVNETHACHESGPIAPVGDVHHHYHFMLETLPRMLHARDFLPTLTFVVSEEVPARYQAIFDFLGLKVAHRERGSVLAADTVVLVDQPQLFWPRAVDIRVLREAFSGEAPGLPSESFYVSRRHAARSLRGESDLETYLGDRGIRSVILEDLPVADQVRLFSHATTVIAPHGAGLAGIAFMQPGASVIEITSGEVFEQCYRRVAALNGVDYRAIRISGTDRDQDGTGVEAIAALEEPLAGKF